MVMSAESRDQQDYVEWKAGGRQIGAMTYVRGLLRDRGVDDAEMPADLDACYELAQVLDRKATEAGPDIETSAIDKRSKPVTEGAVAANLFNELRMLFNRCQMADAFEAKVNAAAKSPAAWLLLREELNGPAKDVEP